MIKQSIEKSFNVRTDDSDNRTNLKDLTFYLLREKKSIQVDLARLSFARIDEAVSDLQAHYTRLLGSGAKLVRSRKIGYHLKIVNTDRSVSNLETLIGERIVLRTESGKHVLLQTEALKRLSVTRLQSEHDILAETLQFIGGVVAVVNEQIENLFRINRMVSNLDVLLQFAKFSTALSTNCSYQISLS